MIRHRWVASCLPLFGVVLAACAGDYAPRDGDIAFQVSTSRQSEAIQRATGSRWSHLGIVHLVDGAPLVFEAVGPVRDTPLAEWIARGKDGEVVIKRLRDAERLLTPAARDQLLAVGRRWRGRPYDLVFAWSDDELYCSELVWKLYHRTLGLAIGDTQRLGDLDLTHPVVQRKLHERYGDAIPLDETVITPGAIFDSPLLETVWRRGPDR